MSKSFDYELFLKSIEKCSPDSDMPVVYVKMYERLAANDISTIGDMIQAGLFEKYSLKQFKELRNHVETLENRESRVQDLHRIIGSISPKKDITFI